LPNGEKATGVGEPAVTVIAPALANAIFNACGAPRPRAADHGGGREGGDEQGIAGPKFKLTTTIRRRHASGGLFFGGHSFNL